MTDSTILPGARAALITGQGQTAPEFYRLFQALARAAGLTDSLQSQVTEITKTVSILAERGSGTIIPGYGIVVDGDLASGQVTLSLDGSGATAGEYGGPLSFPVITVDSSGRITSADEVAIQPGQGISISSVDGVLTISLDSDPVFITDQSGNQLIDQAGNPLIDNEGTPSVVSFDEIQGIPTTLGGYGITDAVPSNRTISAGTGLTGGGSLGSDRTLNLADTTVASGTYGGPGATVAFVVDGQGRLTSASTASIAISWAQVATGRPTTLAGYGITDAQKIGNPVVAPEYTIATLPAATTKDRIIFCSDLVEGLGPLWSDGTNWRRFTDNTVAN